MGYYDSLTLKKALGLFERLEFLNADTTIYVETTGNDNTGDGTLANPYATIGRAFEDFVIRAQYRRTIQIGAGTFQYPENTTHAFIGNGHTILGTTSIDSSFTISGIGASSRDNGHIITVAPNPGWVVDSLVGRHIQYTAGALNNQYGVIYHNTADTIWVSNSATGAWVNPAIADTFNLISLDTTINNPVTSPDRIGLQFDFLIYQDLNFTGGYQGIGYSTIAFNRCHFATEQAAVGAYSRALYWRSYISETAVIPAANVVVAGEKCRFEVDFGTVINGQARSDINMFLGSIMTVGYDCVFANLDAGGINLDDNSAIQRNNQNDNNTMRFYNSAAGIIVDDNTKNVQLMLPYIAGNVASNFLADIQGDRTKMYFNGGTVTTALGTNECTVNGTSESYIADDRDTLIYRAGEVGDYILRSDPETANVDLYVETTGSDTTGNGTVANPYATIGRAFRDIPVNLEHRRTINLGDGTHQWPTYGVSLGFKQEGVFFEGNTSVASSHTINNINSTSQANGMILSVAGAPGWGVDSLVGKHITFTAGAKNGEQGVIYHNEADTIYVTSQSNTWTIPAVNDTFDIIDLDTTINIASQQQYNIRFTRFQSLNITGAFFQAAQSTLQFRYCNVGWNRINAAALSVFRFRTCYINSAAGGSLADMGYESQVRLNEGTVIDGETANDIDMATGSSLNIDEECVFANLPNPGINVNSNCFIGTDFNSDDFFVARFYNCAGFVASVAEGSGNNIYLPYVAGNITANYLIEYTGCENKACIGTGTVETGLTEDNSCSVDGGASESYEDLNASNKIYGIHDLGNYSRYASKRIVKNYNITKFDYYIGVAGTSEPRTVLLPAPATAQLNKVYIIKDESGGAATNNITINTAGAETIDGNANAVISSDYGIIQLITDGSNWFIL